MGHHYTTGWFDPFFSGLASASSTGGAGQFGQIIFNNSDYQRFACVVDFTTITSATGNIDFFMVKGTAGLTLRYQALPMVGDEINPPMQVYTGTSTSAPTQAMYLSGPTTAGGSAWRHDWPFCILPPQYSLLCWSDTANTTIQVGIVFTDMTQEQLHDMRYADVFSKEQQTLKLAIAESRS